MKTFRQEFDKVLGNRTEPEKIINKVCSKYKIADFYFDLSPYISYDMSGETEENWETYVPKEFPGYQLMIRENKDSKINPYSRELIKFTFPKDDRTYPISLKITFLDKKKEDSVASLEDLETCLESFFNSSEYSKLIEKMKHVLLK